MESYISTINDPVDFKNVYTNGFRTFPHVWSIHMRLISKSYLCSPSKLVHRVTLLHHSVESEGEGQGGQPGTWLLRWVLLAIKVDFFFFNIYHTHNVSPNLNEVFQFSRLNRNVLSMTAMFL